MFSPLADDSISQARTFFIPGQGAQDVRNKTDPLDERHPRHSVHQSQIGGKSGPEAAPEVSVAAESQAGVRSNTGRAQDGPGAVQESA